MFTQSELFSNVLDHFDQQIDICSNRINKERKSLNPVCYIGILNFRSAILSDVYIFEVKIYKRMNKNIETMRRKKRSIQMLWERHTEKIGTLKNKEVKMVESKSELKKRKKTNDRKR